ncbi:MAG: universal stress protein [Stackebrandtia sp.]
MTIENRLVVGIDGSEGSRRALRWAVLEAARTDAVVQVVAVWDWNGIDGSIDNAVNPEHAHERAERTLAEVVDEVIAETGTHAAVLAETMRGDPPPVLVRAAAGARLLVLGSHGHSRLRQTLLGSVVEECIRVASCPVLVVPTERPALKSPEAAAAE